MRGLVVGLMVCLSLVGCKIDIDKKRKEIVKIEVRSFLGSWSGSGVYISDDGLIATNFHVVDYKVGVMFVEDYDKTIRPAKVVVVDVVNDLAIIKVEVENHEHATVKSYDLEVGDKVYTYGFPLGMDGVFTDGIVSNRHILGHGAGSNIMHTAIIHPGSSGSPLYDEHGCLVGINNSGSRALGYNFAIPSSDLLHLMKKIGR